MKTYIKVPSQNRVSGKSGKQTCLRVIINSMKIVFIQGACYYLSPQRRHRRYKPYENYLELAAPLKTLE